MYALIKSEKKLEGSDLPERLTFAFVTGAEIYDNAGEIGLKVRLANGDEVDGRQIAGFFDDANATVALNESIGVEVIDHGMADSVEDIGDFLSKLN